MAFLTKDYKIARVIVEGVVVFMVDGDIVAWVFALDGLAGLARPVVVLLYLVSYRIPVRWVFRGWVS